jgi:NADPH2:quinone reductase
MPPSVPATMQVIEISKPGGPEVLHLASRPVPEPKPGEVLIKVAAAGVNRPDCFQRRLLRTSTWGIRSAGTRSGGCLW